MIRYLRTLMGLDRLVRDEKGVAAVEYAFVATPFIIVLLFIIDAGYRMYLGSVVEGTVHRAARLATVGSLTPAQVDDYINQQLTSFSRYATISIDKKSYYEFSGVGKPEKIKQDIAPLGTYNTGDCYEDLNGNNVYDAVAGRTGLGSSDDIVYYKVTATFPRIVPLYKFLGWSNSEEVSANTVLRNQPYASQTVPNVKCD